MGMAANPLFPARLVWTGSPLSYHVIQGASIICIESPVLREIEHRTLGFSKFPVIMQTTLQNEIPECVLLAHINLSLPIDILKDTVAITVYWRPNLFNDGVNRFCAYGNQLRDRFGGGTIIVSHD